MSDHDKLNTIKNENKGEQIMSNQGVLVNESVVVDDEKKVVVTIEGESSEEDIRNESNEENNKDGNDHSLKYKEHESKSDQAVFENLNDLIQHYKEQYQSDTWKYLTWWKNIPSKNKYKAGDLVYITGEKKYGVFLELARKEGLIRVANLKKNKAEVYTRPWYYKLHEIQLVKRNDKIIKGFLQVENSLYKIEV